MIIVAALVLVCSAAILAKSADLAIRSIIELARRRQWSEFLIGFVVLGLATSLPELTIATQSVISDAIALGVGTLIGASLALLTLVLGIAVVYNNGLTLSDEMRRHDVLWMSLLIVAPLVFLLDGTFSRADTAIFVVLYGLYIWHFATRHSFIIEYCAIEANQQKLSVILLTGGTGLIGLIVSSKILVKTALLLADGLNLSEGIIGLVVLGVITNLPELSLALAALRHHHQGIVFGDLLGSAAGNSLILALMALVAPVRFDTLSSLMSVGFGLLLTAVLLNFLLYHRRRISRFYGLGLILYYCAFSLLTLIAVRYPYGAS